MEQHPDGAAFIALLNSTQQAYSERRLEDYLSGFSSDYSSVQVNASFHEDKAGLRRKMEADMARFELLQMDFGLIRAWYSGDIGYGHLRYFTRLRQMESDRVLVDTRENIIVGKRLAEGAWELIGKIVLHAENYFEHPTEQEIQPGP